MIQDCNEKDDYNTYDFIFLKGGVGIPPNMDFIKTGPTPLIHINYSEKDSPLLVNINRIYQYNVKTKKTMVNI